MGPKKVPTLSPETSKTSAVAKSNASLDAINSGMQGVTVTKAVKLFSIVSTDPHTIQTFSKQTPNRIKRFIEVDVYI
jgi:hypothetical protein